MQEAYCRDVTNTEKDATVQNVLDYFITDLRGNDSGYEESSDAEDVDYLFLVSLPCSAECMPKGTSRIPNTCNCTPPYVFTARCLFKHGDTFVVFVFWIFNLRQRKHFNFLRALTFP